MTTTLALQDISRSFGAVRALNGVSLDVQAGSRTAIVGPSGSGKTTLLRIIAGFESADEGRITLGGQLLADGAMSVPAHRRGIGYVPQDGALFPHLSVADNVGFGLPRGDPARTDRIGELMEMVALDTQMLQRRPHELSGGQQQRVALARALAQRPGLMLLDEPFSALDTGLRASTRKAVAALLSGAGITTILVTHDQAEALSFADQVAVLRDGRLVQAGAPIDIYKRPVDLATASFLGESLVFDAHIEAGWAQCVLGRVAVDDGQRSGEAQILLRPEQLLMTPLDAQDAARLAEAGYAGSGQGACHGIVIERDFGGAVCTLSVELLGPRSHAAPLSIRSSPFALVPLGATVRIGIAGQAHVLA